MICWVPPAGCPFIFANCDGTGSDVTVYTHELGHGLQGLPLLPRQPLADYVGLSPDLAGGPLQEPWAADPSPTLGLLRPPHAPPVPDGAPLRLHQKSCAPSAPSTPSKRGSMSTRTPLFLSGRRSSTARRKPSAGRRTTSRGGSRCWLAAICSTTWPSICSPAMW